ncbi:MAG TPA: hypothetical protein VJ044_04320 [Candidatus Hodarchaeales archaeon]|nr:hypothetical protein [Candidatus Hodarchaeales archaeon]
MLGPWCLYCEKELVFGHESVTLTLAIHSVALSHKDLTRESVDVRLHPQCFEKFATQDFGQVQNRLLWQLQEKKRDYA